MKPNELAKLNGAYMRVARRIAGQSRWSAKPEKSDSNPSGHHYSDLEVRQMLCLPSLDCLIRKARLAYAARLANQKSCAPLRALLSVRGKGGQPMPWAKQLHDDMLYMYEHSEISKMVTPPGHKYANDTWCHCMQHERREYAHCIAQIFYCESALDTHASDAPTALSNTHVCMLCRPACVFASKKALDSHSRSKHNATSQIPVYIDNSGVCPACRTSFCSRIRVVAHLSDSRRPKCRDRVLAGEFPRIAHDLFLKLQEQDRIMKRLALREGHTHVIASGSATKLDGKTIGRVTR
jgi:hypothetical protein